LAAGGAEWQLVLLAKELHSRGLRVSVATFYGGGALEDTLGECGISVHCLKKSGRWDLATFMIRLSRWLWTERPDVVHGYLITANLLLLSLRPLLRLRRARVVCGVRGSAAPPGAYDVPTKIAQSLEKRLLPYADLIISNSQAAVRSIGRLGADARAVVIPNGIDGSKYRFDPAERTTKRKEWGVAADEILIGLIGRLDPMKNHQGFMRAASALLEHHPGIRLVCVGTGTPEYRRALQDHARITGVWTRLIWAGFETNMPAVYSALDICCLSSEWGEGFPNVIGEAMSCGLPCVSTAAGDAAEVIGDCGWIVPLGSPERLADALVQAVQALATWDRARPRNRVQTKFSVGTMADRTYAALMPLMGWSK
jgi:glycosyltransferase involved in cell wall biosynthesis